MCYGCQEKKCEHGIENCIYCNDRPGQEEMLEANALVNGERQDDYGTPRMCFGATAKIWSGILAPILLRDITPEEATLMMVGVKLQRQTVKPKRDNIVDAHGYLLAHSHVQQEGSSEQTEPGSIDAPTHAGEEQPACNPGSGDPGPEPEIPF